MYNELTCLFGHHDYSKELTMDKHGHFVYLCKICKRSGHWKWNGAHGAWFKYDEKGYCIHKRWRDGLEVWRGYDEKGILVYVKWSDGLEWRDDRQRLTKKKNPKTNVTCR